MKKPVRRPRRKETSSPEGPSVEIHPKERERYSRAAILDAHYRLMIMRCRFARGEVSYEQLYRQAEVVSDVLSQAFRHRIDPKRGIRFRLHPSELIAMPLFPAFSTVRSIGT